MSARVDKIVTAGTFSLDGGTWEVENNVWILGDDDECLLIDPAHDAAAVAEAVGSRRVVAILLTHAHDDHIRSVADVKALTGAPVLLNPADRVLWDQLYPDVAPDADIVDGQEVMIAGTSVHAVHTPGHSPGSTCYHWADGGVLFSGDTLFHGGPGATGRSFSDFPTIVDSIRNRLLTLPSATIVHTGHGESTSISAEAPHLEEWIARGH